MYKSLPYGIFNVVFLSLIILFPVSVSPQILSNNTLEFEAYATFNNSFYTALTVRDVDIHGTLNANVQAKNLVNFDFGDTSAVSAAVDGIKVVGFMYELQKEKEQAEYLAEQFALINYKLDKVLSQLGRISVKLDSLSAQLIFLDDRLTQTNRAIEDVPAMNAVVQLQGDLLEIFSFAVSWADNREKYGREIAAARSQLSKSVHKIFATNTPLDLHSMALAASAELLIIELSESDREEVRRQSLDVISRHISFWERQLASENSGDISSNTIRMTDGIALRVAKYENQIAAILPITQFPPYSPQPAAPGGTKWKIELEPLRFVATLTNKPVYPQLFLDDGNYYTNCNAFEFQGELYTIYGALDVIGVYEISKASSTLIKRGEFVYPSGNIEFYSSSNPPPRPKVLTSPTFEKQSKFIAESEISNSDLWVERFFAVRNGPTPYGQVNANGNLDRSVPLKSRCMVQPNEEPLRTAPYPTDLRDDSRVNLARVYNLIPILHQNMVLKEIAREVLSKLVDLRTAIAES